VLHLATHGFYLGRERPIDRPLLLAGIALAGANQALETDRDAQDGILYAIEAQDLNLEGTELVVLSACDTAQGQIDYGDGISGLVRALRTAGARHVLVSLRPVSDEGAAAFMRRFYAHWLGQGRSSDPAAALRATQREYLAPDTDTSAASAPGGPDDTWTSLILVGD
jgi:CHAT domain-containing protein